MNRPYTLEELDEELSDLKPEKKSKSILSSTDKKVIAGFRDILRFFERNNRIPSLDGQADVLERCLAIRLNILRDNAAYKELLQDVDEHNILNMQSANSSYKEVEKMTHSELANELADLNSLSEMTELKHVRSMAVRRESADWVTTREPCRDFDRYQALFDSVKEELKHGIRKYYSLEKQENKQVEAGRFYVIEGQMLYIASIGNSFVSKQTKIKEQKDARAYVIYDNKTESHPLVSSIIKAMYEDKMARGITVTDPGPLFAEYPDEHVNGKIYVLRSLSSQPFISENRKLIHKIGVTTGSIKKRIASAKDDPTYLLAEVEVVAEYDLKGINPSKLENLLHRIFSSVQLDIEIPDRFNRKVKPREWFLVPLKDIEKASDLIQAGKAEGLTYNRNTLDFEYQS